MEMYKHMYVKQGAVVHCDNASVVFATSLSKNVAQVVRKASLSYKLESVIPSLMKPSISLSRCRDALVSSWTTEVVATARCMHTVVA